MVLISFGRALGNVLSRSKAPNYGKHYSAAKGADRPRLRPTLAGLARVLSSVGFELTVIALLFELIVKTSSSKPASYPTCNLSFRSLSRAINISNIMFCRRHISTHICFKLASLDFKFFLLFIWFFDNQILKP